MIWLDAELPGQIAVEAPVGKRTVSHGGIWSELGRGHRWRKVAVPCRCEPQLGWADPKRQCRGVWGRKSCFRVPGREGSFRTFN